jgi:hypothetical protein
MLTKLRISTHSLVIETGRYGATKIPADQRFCKFCPTNVEDDILMEIAQYIGVFQLTLKVHHKIKDI